MAYIQDNVLHDASVDEFKAIAKDFASELRRVCPELKQTAALDLFSSLHYPNLSFSSAVPMIKDRGFAKPLRVNLTELELRFAIKYARPRTKELLLNNVDLSEVLPRWETVVNAVFPTRYVSANPQEKDKPRHFIMTLAVSNDEKAEFIEVLKDIASDGVASARPSTETVEKSLEHLYEGSTAQATAPSLIRVQELAGVEYDIYKLTDENDLNVNFPNETNARYLNRLCKFAICQAFDPLHHPLPDCPDVYLQTGIKNHYDLLLEWKGKHEYADLFFKALDDVITSFKRGSIDEDYKSWGFKVRPFPLPSGHGFLINFSGKSHQYIEVVVARNGLFIRKLHGSDPRAFLQPLDQVETGDFFVKSKPECFDDLEPEVFEVVGKTERGVELRSIEYEIEFVGKGLPEQYDYQVIPRPGKFLAEPIFKEVLTPRFDIDVRVPFEATDESGNKRTVVATHFHKARAFKHVIFKEE